MMVLPWGSGPAANLLLLVGVIVAVALGQGSILRRIGGQRTRWWEIVYGVLAFLLLAGFNLWFIFGQR